VPPEASEKEPPVAGIPPIWVLNGFEVPLDPAVPPFTKGEPPILADAPAIASVPPVCD
jgi:hypothetical protein